MHGALQGNHVMLLFSVRTRRGRTTIIATGGLDHHQNSTKSGVNKSPAFLSLVYSCICLCEIAYACRQTASADAVRTPALFLTPSLEKCCHGTQS